MTKSIMDKKRVPAYENRANTADSFIKIPNDGMSRSSIIDTTPKIMRS
ncbi:hypothetical protein [Butyrivibrio hungatei]|nr:hypothetical protein [Butyrivibrio hungatei]